MIKRPICLLIYPLLMVISSMAAAAQTAQTGGMSAAMAMARDGAWAAALETARPLGDTAVYVIKWQALRDGDGAFTDYLDFLRRNPDWPGLQPLRRRGEAKIGPTTPDRQVLDFFATRHAQTAHGALYLARALEADARPDAARAELVLAWRTLSFSRSEQAIFMREFPDLLTPHIEARLDHLLWLGRHADVKRLMPFLSPGAQAEARARMGLRNLENGVNALINKVPADRLNSPGLAFERFFWRSEKGQRTGAEMLLLERSASAELLGRPGFWSSTRRTLARDALRQGRAQQAYALAAGHQLFSGTNFADLEWFAGYVALTRLGNPALALQHFQAFRAGVDSPISLGRAGYWEARAYLALNRPDDAAVALQFAAEFQTGFYGLLAAQEAGLSMDPALLATVKARDPDAAFLQSRVLAAARLLAQAGETRMAARFFIHLAEQLDDADFAHLGDIALELDEPHVAVTLAKFAATQGVILPGPYFPRKTLAGDAAGVAPELTMSIMRRESEFFPGAVSRAGARGLMQLMPRTAREVSGWLDLPYSADALLEDGAYNTTLGNAYLASIQREFGNNVLLIAASYNAGPTRTAGWVKRYGDPRRLSTAQILDWIENIPFRETRNYVMRVAESVVIYRARLAGELQPIRIAAELGAR